MDDATLRALYELYKWGPTALNCQPMRVVFVRSPQGKATLKEALAPGNVERSMAAPATAIVAHDSRFYEKLPEVAPFLADKAALFTENERFAEETAFRNSSLQGAYLIVAARMLGLAAGPMSGFDAERVNATFFPDGRWRANFLVNLGWPAADGYRPRQPRLPFEEVVRIG